MLFRANFKSVVCKNSVIRTINLKQQKCSKFHRRDFLSIKTNSQLSQFLIKYLSDKSSLSQVLNQGVQQTRKMNNGDPLDIFFQKKFRKFFILSETSGVGHILLKVFHFLFNFFPNSL